MPSQTRTETNEFDRWMSRHNGPDAITRILIALSIVMIAVGFLTRLLPIAVASVIVLLVAAWRILSTNIIGRRKEEGFVLQHAGPLRPWLANPTAAAREHRMSAHVQCPTCGQKARLPKGVGQVLVSCPACGNKYLKKA